MIWPPLVANWGSTAVERAQPFPCDRLVGSADHVLFRAVDVRAPVQLTFRWLCQLRAAPYSYDRLDNRGRRSPQTLTPGLEQLAVGQRVQSVFTLVEFEEGRSLTMSHVWHSRLTRLVLPPGDLLMMRRQLLNLKGLAERSAREGTAV
ncbi:MAG: hypothetical protein ABSB73_00810 [Solirubrobacteraceae bacterium]